MRWGDSDSSDEEDFKFKERSSVISIGGILSSASQDDDDRRNVVSGERNDPQFLGHAQERDDGSLGGGSSASLQRSSSNFSQYNKHNPRLQRLDSTASAPAVIRRPSDKKKRDSRSRRGKNKGKNKNGERFNSGDNARDWKELARASSSLVPSYNHGDRDGGPTAGVDGSQWMALRRSRMEAKAALEEESRQQESVQQEQQRKNKLKQQTEALKHAMQQRKEEDRSTPLAPRRSWHPLPPHPPSPKPSSRRHVPYARSQSMYILHTNSNSTNNHNGDIPANRQDPHWGNLPRSRSTSQHTNPQAPSSPQSSVSSGTELAQRPRLMLAPRTLPLPPPLHAQESRSEHVPRSAVTASNNQNNFTKILSRPVAKDCDESNKSISDAKRESEVSQEVNTSIPGETTSPVQPQTLPSNEQGNNQIAQNIEATNDNESPADCSVVADKIVTSDGSLIPKKEPNLAQPLQNSSVGSEAIATPALINTNSQNETIEEVKESTVAETNLALEGNRACHEDNGDLEEAVERDNGGCYANKEENSPRFCENDRNECNDAVTNKEKELDNTSKHFNISSEDHDNSGHATNLIAEASTTFNEPQPPGHSRKDTESKREHTHRRKGKGMEAAKNGIEYNIDSSATSFPDSPRSDYSTRQGEQTTEHNDISGNGSVHNSSTHSSKNRKKNERFHGRGRGRPSGKVFSSRNSLGWRSAGAIRQVRPTSDYGNVTQESIKNLNGPNFSVDFSSRENSGNERGREYQQQPPHKVAGRNNGGKSRGRANSTEGRGEARGVPKQGNNYQAGDQRNSNSNTGNNHNHYTNNSRKRLEYTHARGRGGRSGRQAGGGGRTGARK